jgi:uncharacterized membrane protein YfcA
MGALTQSLIGFGLAIVAAPLLYIVNPSLVPISIILIGFYISVLTLYREKIKIRFDGIQYALLGRIPGALLGTWLLLIAPQPLLGIIIASIVTIAIIATLLKFNMVVNNKSLFIAGILSGLFSNIAAIGGPPLAILLSGKNSQQFRSTLSLFFIFSTVISMSIFFAAGMVSLNHFYSSILLLPAVLTGHFIGGKLIKHTYCAAGAALRTRSREGVPEELN